MQSEAATVDEYLAELPDDRREALEAIRAVILKNLPKDGAEDPPKVENDETIELWENWVDWTELNGMGDFQQQQKCYYSIVL